MKKADKIIYFILTFTVLLTTNFYITDRILNLIKNGTNYSNHIFKITYTQNTGAAFSIMQNSTLFLILISCIALAAAIYYFVKNINQISLKSIFCLNILLCGIVGNLYERLTLGYVRDFFDLVFINFPIFNVSDIFINIGVFAIIIIILFTKNQIKLL